MFRQRASEIFRRNRGVSMQARLTEFRRYATGWLNYFALDQVQTTFRRLDKWLRRRVRACFWKYWRKSKTRLRELKRLGIDHEDARAFACSGKGAWRLSTTSGVQRALSNAHLSALGLLSLSEKWSQLASLRRNRPVRTRMLRWCGRGPGAIRAPMPMYAQHGFCCCGVKVPCT